MTPVFGTGRKAWRSAVGSCMSANLNILDALTALARVRYAGKMAERVTAASIVDLCTSENGVATACEAIEAFAENGQWQELAGLAASLETKAAAGSKGDRAYFETVVDHVEDHLALCPGEGAVDAMLALSLVARAHSVVIPRSHALRERAFASRLGFGQKPEAFVAALARLGTRAEYREVLACWMHEIVLRGHPLTDPASVAFHAGLGAAGHPLGGLPLTLRSLEREAPTYMPLYGEASLGSAIEALANQPRAGHTMPPPADASSVEALQVVPADDRLSAAVKPWADGKRGKVEAKIFSLAKDLDPNEVGSWLVRALPLESIEDATKLVCVRVVGEGVFGPLFAAAANGGAYSPGLGGAYARLAAWTSFGALVGAPAHGFLDVAALDALEARGAACVYLSFRTSGPWFHDVAWDLGILAVRDDGKSVAVLAATDA